MLVVRRNDPLSPSRECIIVLRMVLNVSMTALHIQLEHPSGHQLKQVMRRYLFALDLDRAIETPHSCHHCASLINTPTMTVPQYTSDPPEVVGISYAADTIKRERQLILVLRECVNSYTACCFVTDERRDTIRDTLINVCIGLRPLDDPPAAQLLKSCFQLLLQTSTVAYETRGFLHESCGRNATSSLTSSCL